MHEKIKSNLKLYNELAKTFILRHSLSEEQSDFLFKSLNPPIDSKIIDEFEKSNNIQFPIEYKLFLTEIGNGTGNTWESAGMGPDMGILKVLFKNNECFIFNDTEIDLKNPFQFTEEYNLENCEDLAEKFTNWLDNYTKEFRNEVFQLREPTLEEFEGFITKNGENPRKEYYEKFELNGVLPICGIGCGEYYFIVITGKSKGEIWIDYRDNWGGISPVLDKKGNRQRFDSWYHEWLEEEIGELKNKLIVGSKP